MDGDELAVSSDCFCDLCNLDFTTRRELEEHTWSMLHNTNLNRKQGRDCVHPCSLCKEQFIGLLEFTGHLHSDNHQENIHKWRKDQQQEWSPDKQQQCSPDEQLQSPCHKEEDKPPSELAPDDLSGVRDIQDTCSTIGEGGEPIMGDSRWRSGRGRGSVGGIPSLLEDLPPVGYHYPERLDMRRGMPPNQPWQNDRYERGYPHDGRPMWDSGQREPQREFRDGPWYNPVWPGMDDSRNFDGWQNESYPVNRDGDRYLSRDSSRSYFNHDDYAPDSRQRDSFEGDSEVRPRYDGQQHDLRDRITRRDGNSLHPTYNGQQKMKSVVGSSSLTSRENEGRFNSGSGRHEGRGSSSSQRHTPPGKLDQGRRSSKEMTRRDSRDKSQLETSPSGKSARKSKPRKLARSEEKTNDISTSGDTAATRKSLEVNLLSTKGSESGTKKKEETAMTEKEKSGTESASASASRSVAGDEKSRSKVDKSDMESNNSISKGTASTKPLLIKNKVEFKDTSSSGKRDFTSTKGDSSKAHKGDSSSAPKRGSSSSSKGSQSSSTNGNSSSSTKRDSSSAGKGDSSASPKRDLAPLVRGVSSPSAKGDSAPLVREVSSPSAKGDSSSTAKGDSSLAGQRDSSSPNGDLTPLARGASSPSAKEDFSSTAKGGFRSSAKGDSMPSLETGRSSLITAKEKVDLGKPSNKQKDSLSSVNDKDKLITTSSKGPGEVILPFPEKKTLVASLHEKNNVSQNSREAVNTVPLPKMEEVSLSSTGEKSGQASSLSCFNRNTSSSSPGIGEEKAAQNQGANIPSESEQNDSISYSAATTYVGSLPWGQREEELRALLGIKKEPKDEESQQDIIPCSVSKSNKMTMEDQANHPFSSSSISAVNSLTSGSNKSTTSRYVPAASQLSLSRPQCSFLHIDGIQCGAITWNKYCSYHQRVFKSDETNTHEQSIVSEGSQYTRNESTESSESPRRIGRPGGTQIFRPTTPPYDPPKRFGVDGRADTTSGVKPNYGLFSHNKTDRKQKEHSGNYRDNKEHSKEIDLSSTVSYTALGAAGGPHRNIDLSFIVRGATRSLLLHGSSSDISSGPSVDLSDTVPKPGGTLKPYSTTLGNTVTTEPGIDLSGTVPNLEELLTLHGSSADKQNPSKTVLKHGRSWNQQTSSADSGPNIDLSVTVPYRGGSRHLGASSVDSENGSSIDLNETVAQPGRSGTPLDGSGFANANLEGQAAKASSVTSHLKGDVGRDVAQKISLKTLPERESASAFPTPNVKTEMIDLNFSTKLLGVPHSVVTPFNTSLPSPKKPTREMTKSPSEFSTKSSNPGSPRSYAPSSPQSRRVSTSPMPGDQSPTSTISLPNLSLDLSRFNLPPGVRKALAERYSGKRVPSITSGQSAEFPEGRRSQPLFTDHARTEAPNEQGKKLSPLPARLRGRGQRSISLDSPLRKKENLRGEGSSRTVLLERGNINDTNRFLSRPFREISEGHNQRGLSASDRNSMGLFTGSNNVLPSTNVPSLSVPSTNVPMQGNSNELQSRGFIDLSSTSYLEGMSMPPTNQDRPTEATRPTIDNSRSPARPSVLQSRGFIDLNTTSTDFGAPDVVMESPEALSVIKRKRLNSFEGSETSSNLGAEKLVKRLKQEEASAQEEKVVTYRPGINVQQLLTIERDEQDQLQNLHAVQSRLKSVRAQIQKLCTELDSLSSEEQRITLKMGELRNMRLNILENACYERQGQITRVKCLTRESSKSTVDDNRTFPVSGKSGRDDSLEYEHTMSETHISSSSRRRNSHDDTSRATERNDDRANYVEEEQMSTELEFDDSSTSHGDEGPLLNTSKSSDYPKVESRVSVGTATKFVFRDKALHSTQPHEKFQEKLNVAPKRSSNRRETFNEVDLTRGAKNIAQASRGQISENATSRELAERVPARHHDNDPSSFDGGSERCSIIAPVTFTGPAPQKQNESSKSNETRKDLMKKMKHMHLPEKVPQRKKSFSDVNVSKTIEASRKKIQSARENMKRWKEQELGGDMRTSNEDPKKKHSSSSSTESIENPLEISGLDEPGSSPVKLTVRDKTSTRKTTKDFKKSSLFHSGKKSSKETRKNRVDKTHWKDKEKTKQIEAVPSKRRKIDDNSCNRPCSVPPEDKTSTKEKGQVVSAAAHTTTIDLGGSGTEERSSAEDEIPTRDVDGQFVNAPSAISRHASHLQIPSSTVESLKKSLQNSKGGRQHRGPLANKFTGHTGAVCGLKVHNGHLFTCSADKTTRSFNIQTGQCVKLYHGHHQAVNCIEVSVDSDRMFTGSNDQTVRSYNIKSGVCTHKFTFDGRVMCLHAAFDLLFVGLSTGIVASIDLSSNKCLERLHCHEPRGVSCLTTATEGQRKLLCSGSFDSTIAIRDCKTGLLLRTFSDHNMTVLCLQVVENVLYSGSADMKVQAHNLNSGELLRCFEGHTMSVSGLQVVGSVLVTSCLDKLIRCYDLVTAELLQVYGGQMDMIFSVHVNNGRIYSGARDGSIVAAKLDLRVYHPCKWRECKLNFGIVTHLKNHIREYHVMEQGTVEACHWADCGHQFSADDDISVVLKHVLGHVVTRTARKSAT